MNFLKKHKSAFVKMISASAAIVIVVAMAVSVFAQEQPIAENILPANEQEEAVQDKTETGEVEPAPAVTDQPSDPTPEQSEDSETAETPQPTVTLAPEPTSQPTATPTPEPSAQQPQPTESVMPEILPAVPVPSPVPMIEPTKEAAEDSADQAAQDDEITGLEPGAEEAVQQPAYTSPAVFLTDISAKGSDDTLKLTDEELAEIEKALPTGLDPYRREIVLKAYSLAGKVHYFWGGKSTQTGWDIRWGNEAIVGSAGSSQTGTTREYGLDCSGYVLWCFLNAEESIALQNEAYKPAGTTELVNKVGYGTASQWAHSSELTWEEALPGDILFYKNPKDAGINHVGIIVGANEEGEMLVAHCSSSKNNVVISKVENSGFRYVRRMDYIAERENAEFEQNKIQSNIVLPNGMPMFLTDEQAYEGAALNGWPVN